MAYIRRRTKRWKPRVRSDPLGEIARVLGRKVHSGEIRLRDADAIFYSLKSGEVTVYELVESRRQDQEITQRFLLHLGPFEDVDAIKLAIRLRRDRVRYMNSPRDDPEMIRLRRLLDRIAEILVARPQSMERLWPGAHEWLWRRQNRDEAKELSRVDRDEDRSRLRRLERMIASALTERELQTSDDLAPVPLSSFLRRGWP